MIKSVFTRLIRPVMRRVGFDMIRYKDAAASNYPPDFSPLTIAICDRVRPFTMTSPERVHALIEAVQYVVQHNIEGALVECGVWKGGSSMAMALILQHLGAEDRTLYLYDTFTGMSAPGEVDISFIGEPARERFLNTRITEDASDWCRSPLEEVKENVFGTGYKQEHIHFIEGKVEDTIPAMAPREIALLRLDTDWYASTKHELIHLFPRLKRHGVLIIDDYGHWEGARKAVDEYLAEHNIRLLLNRIDYTGRIAIKT